MTANLSIRSATLADVEAISHVIIRTLKEVNAKDYPDKDRNYCLHSKYSRIRGSINFNSITATGMDKSNQAFTWASILKMALDHKKTFA